MIKFYIAIISITLASATPMAIFHGFGDFCAQPGMKRFTKQLGELVGDYSHCVEIGSGSISSIFMDFRKQAQKACENVKGNPQFQGKTIHVVGLSQGALLARYIASDCDFGGKVDKILSIGGPQMGVTAIPHCGSGPICWPFNRLTRSLVYTSLIQHHVGPAGYFRDSKNLEGYQKHSIFLADLNNERNFSSSRRDKITQLSGFMLVKFTKDTMIHPRETAWFEELDQDGNKIDLENTRVYREDLIGLRTLREKGRVNFVEIEGDHLRFTQNDINNTFVPFLKD